MQNNLQYTIKQIIDSYFDVHPNYDVKEHRVKFGTSGHRGISTSASFNIVHILAICQSICDYRNKYNITGPIFIGMDTHALSLPAMTTALEVFTANDITVIFEGFNKYTATPVISHAILSYNSANSKSADGLIITSSHNPPEYGGIKYNPYHGGGANLTTTAWIQQQANNYIARGITKIKRKSYSQAQTDGLVKIKDLLGNYIAELNQVLNIDAICSADLAIGVDPLGGASISFWQRITDYYKMNIDIICDQVAPDFNFLVKDKDGRVRMDCASSWVMSPMIDRRKSYDLSLGNDTDADRHAIISPKQGLLHTNDYLGIAIDYLHNTRNKWQKQLLVGKSIVTSNLITAVAESKNCKIYESPVGCKWFAPLLYNSTMTFGGEESAGGSFLRKNAKPWCTDKDGLVMNLLAAEILSVTGTDVYDYKLELEKKHGIFINMRKDVFIKAEDKIKFNKINFSAITPKQLGSNNVNGYQTKAPANCENIGGIKWSTTAGWVALRTSGTEPLYKIYSESFIDRSHAEQMVNEVLHLIETNLK